MEAASQWHDQISGHVLSLAGQMRSGKILLDKLVIHNCQTIVSGRLNHCLSAIRLLNPQLFRTQVDSYVITTGAGNTCYTLAEKAGQL